MAGERDMAAAHGARLPDEAPVRRRFPRPRVAAVVGSIRCVAIRSLALAALLTPATLPGTAHGDSRGFAIELRAGAASATGRLAGHALEVGLGIDAQLSWAVTPYMALYAGYGRRELASDGGEKAILEHEGYALGVELRWSEPRAHVGFRFAAGLTRERLESIDDPGLALADSSGRGWELGAAVLVPLAGGWSLAPGLRFRSLSRALAFEDDAPVDDDELELVMLEVGALWAF